MHNYAYDNARDRRDLILQNMRYEGRSESEIAQATQAKIRLTRWDVQVAPDGVTRVNMVATLAAYILLAWAIFA